MFIIFGNIYSIYSKFIPGKNNTYVILKSPVKLKRSLLFRYSKYLLSSLLNITRDLNKQLMEKVLFKSHMAVFFCILVLWIEINF